MSLEWCVARIRNGRRPPEAPTALTYERPLRICRDGALFHATFGRSTRSAPAWIRSLSRSEISLGHESPHLPGPASNLGPTTSRLRYRVRHSPSCGSSCRGSVATHPICNWFSVAIVVQPRRRSVTIPPDTRTRSSGLMSKMSYQVPAAAQATSYCNRSGSMNTRS